MTQRKAIFSQLIWLDLLNCHGILEPAMLYNDKSSTRETLLFPVIYRYDRQCASKESQMGRRESDGRIVLLKVGNSTGGKARGGGMG